MFFDFFGWSETNKPENEGVEAFKLAKRHLLDKKQPGNLMAGSLKKWWAVEDSFAAHVDMVMGLRPFLS